MSPIQCGGKTHWEGQKSRAPLLSRNPGEKDKKFRLCHSPDFSHTPTPLETVSSQAAEPPPIPAENWSPSGVALMVSQCRRQPWGERPRRGRAGRGKTLAEPTGLADVSPLSQPLTRRFSKRQ